jgi:RNA polymerase sigma-70 factor, ECF subfamily
VGGARGGTDAEGRAVSAVEAIQRPAFRDTMIAAAQSGDEHAFAALVERHRRELRVHCYRMLGSLEDAEDVVQETFLRAWRALPAFVQEGSWSFRAWLYRIATNACLDVLKGRPRRVLPQQLAPAADHRAELQPSSDLPWLQPFPDRLLEGIRDDDAGPDEELVSKETIELAFLAAIQLLPPRQRAALIVRDVLGWSAKETASLLEASVASANSAVQRARATLKSHLPSQRVDWRPSTSPNEVERRLLKRYMEAYEAGDGTALAAALREDARLVMPPFLDWYQGRDAIVAFAQPFLDEASPTFRGRLQGVATAANRQPAVAWYVPDDAGGGRRALSIDVLRIEEGAVAEVVGFVFPQLFPSFGLRSAI